MSSSNTICNNIIFAYDEAAKKHILVKYKVKQHVSWLNKDIAEKKKAVFEALDYSNRLKTRSSANKLDDVRIQLEEAYVREQERYAQGKVGEMRTAAEYLGKEWNINITKKRETLETQETIVEYH